MKNLSLDCNTVIFEFQYKAIIHKKATILAVVSNINSKNQSKKIKKYVNKTLQVNKKTKLGNKI